MIKGDTRSGRYITLVSLSEQPAVSWPNSHANNGSTASDYHPGCPRPSAASSSKRLRAPGFCMVKLTLKDTTNSYAIHYI